VTAGGLSAISAPETDVIVEHKRLLDALTTD